MISSDESLSESYGVGLEKAGEFFKSKEIKIMVKDVLTEDDKKKIKNNSIEKYNCLCNKLNLEENHIYVIDSDFDESEISEISVEDEFNCYSFVETNVEL